MVCHKSQLELLKKLHDVQNVLRERRKQVQYAEALKNTCFLDGYLKNELSLVLYLDVVMKGNDVGRCGLGAQSRAVDDIAICIFHDDPLNASVGPKSEQEEVFVRNIELVKGPDNAILPSLVRLHVGDFGQYRIEEGGAGGIYFNATESRFNFLPRLQHREFIEAGNSIGVISLNSSRPRVFQRDPEIMKSVSGDQGHIQESGFPSWNVVYQLLVSSLSIALNCCSLTFFERENSSACPQYVSWPDQSSGGRHEKVLPCGVRYRECLWLVMYIIAFAFDPRRAAILLVAGDKSGGSQKRFYRDLIRKADQRFGSHLSRLKKKGNSDVSEHPRQA